jgi:hypothetical protein
LFVWCGEGLNLKRCVRHESRFGNDFSAGEPPRFYTRSAAVTPTPPSLSWRVRAATANSNGRTLSSGRPGSCRRGRAGPF